MYRFIYWNRSCDDVICDCTCDVFLQTDALASIFLLSHGEFLSGWCSSDLPVYEDDTTLEYDSFVPAGWVLKYHSLSNYLNTENSKPTFVLAEYLEHPMHTREHRY